MKPYSFKICSLSMKQIFYTLLFVLQLTACLAQQTARQAHCANPAFDAKVESLIKFSVPTISVEQLKAMEDVFIADAREEEEYQVSHIPTAQYVGHKDFDVERLAGADKDTPIVVYCSVGYRSEKIGEQLQEMGYTEVYNLYGSIFEWVNQGNLVVDALDNTTDRVHTYNKKWSQWLDDGKAVEVW